MFIYFCALFVTLSLSQKLPGANIDIDHLKLPHVIKACGNMDVICDGQGSVICTMRVYQNKSEVKQFDNSCFLFLSNMCDQPQNEYYLSHFGPCADYLNARRDIDITDFQIYDKRNRSLVLRNFTFVRKSTKAPITTTKKKAKRRPKKKGLREDDQEEEEEVDVPRTYDDHVCPVDCPNLYKPICLVVNMYEGLYFRMYHFLNHCFGDKHYCEHPEEYPKTDKGDLEVLSSEITYAHCADQRYMNAARFYEYASSLSYYGWLYNSTAHFATRLDPDKRAPGFGNIEFVGGHLIKSSSNS